MGVEELLDEEAFDPKKLFNEEEYSTLIISRDGMSKKDNTTADFIEALLEEKNSRQENEEIYSKLKEAKAQKMLVESIHAANKTQDKTKLIAACWECGLDFSEYFLDFVKLSIHPDFQIALEALSVVESCDSPLNETVLTSALEIAESGTSAHVELLNDLIANIKNRIA